MALTKAERETLASLTEKAKKQDEEEAGFEVWVKNEKGHQVQLKGARAKSFLKQFGIKDDDQEEEETEEETEEELPEDEAPAGDKGSYWRGGKK
jgi:uroporphyrinogen-III synthase